MSSAAIWRNAPSTIRQGHSPIYSEYNPNDKLKTGKAMTANKTTEEETANNFTTPTRTGNTSYGSSISAHNNNTLSHRTSASSHPSRQTISPYIRQVDDNTITTFHSTTSTTLNSSQYAQRFTDLEASIKAHQSDFRTMNTRHETMENRLLETMSSCHENTKQLVTMQGQLSNLQNTMQVIAEQMNLLTQHVTRPSEGKRDTGKTDQSPVKKKVRQDTDNRESTSRHETGAIIPRITNAHHETHNDENNPSNLAARLSQADQEESQYTQTRFPGAAMEE
jgi:hypothetical protein